MRVTINGYGLVEFKPTELYRFDGSEDSTQLRGKVRIQRPDLDVRTTSGEEWMDYDFWFTLDQVIIDSTDDLNLMVGLKAVTDLAAPTIKDCSEEVEVVDEQPIFRDHKYVRYDFNGTEFAVIQKGEDVFFKCGGVEFSPYEVLKDIQFFDWSVFNPALGKNNEESSEGNAESLFEDYNSADDTDIEEEMQKVLEELKSTNIYSSNYHMHLSTLERLINIREKI